MVVTLANGMSRRIDNLDLVVANAVGPYLSEVDKGVRLVDLGGKRVSAALPALVRYLRAERPDVLMSTLSHVNVMALVAKKIAGVATLVVVREASTPSAERVKWSSPKAALARLMMNASYRSADGVVAVSAGVAESIREIAGLPEDRVATLYNPVVTPGLAQLSEQSVSHAFLDPKVAPVILNVGSLREVKDHETLIRAFRVVVDRMDARLLILGEGPERRRLESLVAELGLDGRVDMPGFDSNPFAYMSRSDLYALTSRREGLPGALIQALACGLPAVSTDCRSGPREVLENGSLGALVPVGDFEALAEAMLRALRHPPERRDLIAHSARYDAERVIDGYVEYFRNLAQMGRT